MHRGKAVHDVDGPYVSSTGGVHHHWAVGVFEGSYTWLLGGTCRRWGVRVEGRAKVNHDLRRGSPCQQFLRRWRG